MTMYTPDDIRNIQFTKSMGGYKTAEVDPFIDKCADTVEALLREKAELTKKLEVLADKLVEYRNDEDNIRTALLSAQRLGDTVVREANHKAGLILEDANIKAEKITSVAKRNIQEEEAELERIKREVAAFKKKMLSMYRDHLTLIDALPELKEEPPRLPKSPPRSRLPLPSPRRVPPRLWRLSNRWRRSPPFPPRRRFRFPLPLWSRCLPSPPTSRSCRRTRSRWNPLSPRRCRSLASAPIPASRI